jgi:hypothetical protein
VAIHAEDEARLAQARDIATIEVTQPMKSEANGGAPGDVGESVDKRGSQVAAATLTGGAATHQPAEGRPRG